MNVGVPVGDSTPWMKPDPRHKRAERASRNGELRGVRIAARSVWPNHPKVAGGQWRIRTSEGVIQLIYSQSRLAASVTAPVNRHPRLPGGVVTHTGLSPDARAFVKQRNVGASGANSSTPSAPQVITL